MQGNHLNGLRVIEEEVGDSLIVREYFLEFDETVITLEKVDGQIEVQVKGQTLTKNVGWISCFKKGGKKKNSRTKCVMFKRSKERQSMNYKMSKDIYLKQNATDLADDAFWKNQMVLKSGKLNLTGKVKLIDQKMVTKALVISRSAYKGEQKEKTSKRSKMNNENAKVKKEKRIRIGNTFCVKERKGDTLYISFRGTKDFKDLLADGNIRLDSRDLRVGLNFSKIAKFHKGFAGRAEMLINKLVRNICKRALPHRIVTCGHSLGGAISQLVHIQLHETFKTELQANELELINITFGAPMMGNYHMREALNSMKASKEGRTVAGSMFNFVLSKDVIPALLFLLHPSQYRLKQRMENIGMVAKLVRKIKLEKVFRVVRNTSVGVARTSRRVPILGLVLAIIELVPELCSMSWMLIKTCIPELREAQRLRNVISRMLYTANPTDTAEFYAPIGNYMYMMKNGNGEEGSYQMYEFPFDYDPQYTAQAIAHSLKNMANIFWATKNYKKIRKSHNIKNYHEKLAGLCLADPMTESTGCAEAEECKKI